MYKKEKCVKSVKSVKKKSATLRGERVSGKQHVTILNQQSRDDMRLLLCQETLIAEYNSVIRL